MTNSIEKNVLMSLSQRAVEGLPVIRGSLRYVWNFDTSLSGSAFSPTDQWGEPSRLDAESAIESALQILGSTVPSGAPGTVSDPWESPQHLEAAAVMDRLARGLLWKISDCAFISGTEVVELADDYDGLRAVLRVVRAGWATAAPDGLLVTDHGRDVAGRMFVDR